MSESDQYRAGFEAWARDNGHPIRFNADGSYAGMNSYRWEGYVGARREVGAEPIEGDVERIQINLVELTEDSERNQACEHGSLVDGHAVYCHNSTWSDAPRKCRRTWYTGGEVRDEDCDGFKARVLVLAHTKAGSGK